MKHGVAVERLLKRIHRVRVMLWARDYRSAETEMKALARQHRKLLDDSQRAETILREQKTDIKKSGMEDVVYMKYGNLPFKKYQLEYLIDIETTREAVRQSSNEFDADDFAVSPITRTVRQLEKQIEQSRKLSSSLVPDLDQDRNAAKYFISFEQLDSTRVSYRILRFDISHPLSGALIADRLAEVFEVTPTLTDPDNEDYALPLQVRFFTREALLEVAIYDQERLVVEITSSHRVQPHDVFKRVYEVISGTLA